MYNSNNICLGTTQIIIMEVLLSYFCCFCCYRHSPATTKFSSSKSPQILATTYNHTNIISPLTFTFQTAQQLITANTILLLFSRPFF